MAEHLKKIPDRGMLPWIQLNKIFFLRHIAEFRYDAI